MSSRAHIRHQSRWKCARKVVQMRTATGSRQRTSWALEMIDFGEVEKCALVDLIVNEGPSSDPPPLGPNQGLILSSVPCTSSNSSLPGTCIIAHNAMNSDAPLIGSGILR